MIKINKVKLTDSPIETQILMMFCFILVYLLNKGGKY